MIFADDGSHKLLGAHIIGGEATEMIAETGLALQLGATWKDIENTSRCVAQLWWRTWQAGVNDSGGQPYNYHKYYSL